jgi:hypothetical protein
MYYITKISHAFVSYIWIEIKTSGIANDGSRCPAVLKSLGNGIETGRTQPSEATSLVIVNSYKQIFEPAHRDSILEIPN